MALTQLFPFTFRNGITVRYDKKNTMRVLKNIRVLFEKQFLDENDTAILLHLQKYGYLNSFLLRLLLSRQLEKCTTDFCNNRLKKLVKLGFIIRFQFIYNDENGTEHATPFVYNLSMSGRRLFPVKDDKSYTESGMDIDYVQRRLSYNQFHILFEGQYEGALQYSSYIFGNEYDGLYKLTSGGKPIVLYVLSIRSSDGWEKSYLDRLRILNNYILSASLSCSGIIIICENEMQSLKAERSRSGDKELKDMDVYYVCDYASVAEGCLLQYIISVKPEQNFSCYDIIRINIDGPVKENVVNKGE